MQNTFDIMNRADDPRYIVGITFLQPGVAMSTFKVPDMTCGHCVKSITEAIKQAAPSAEVTCDLSTKLVTVTGMHDPGKVHEAVTDAGYSPEFA